MDQDYTVYAQDRPCRKFKGSRKKDAVFNLVASKAPQCVGCAQNPPKPCVFYKVDGRNRVLEQRTFKVSADGTILDCIPHEHRGHVKPVFNPMPPFMTKEIVEDERQHAFWFQSSSGMSFYGRFVPQSSTVRRDRTKIGASAIKAKKYQCQNDPEGQDEPVAPPKDHDFALLEFFQPNELEDALSILKPLPHPVPPPRSDADEPGIIRFDLARSASLPTYSDVYRALASGIPLVVSGINAGEDNLTPEYFIERHGSCKVDVVNTETGVKRTVSLSSFMETFDLPRDPSNPEKLKDWPPTAHFAKEFPKLFKLFEEVIVAPLITSRTGAMNMEIHMPEGCCPPDTGPKAYLAQGAAGGTTTRLHCDMTDAVNIMFYSKGVDNVTAGGAEWTMIDREHMPLAGRLLRERMKGQFEGHPIHSQALIISEGDVAFLRENGVRVWVFTQMPGEAVFIPAGVGHQVTNLTSCIKIAVDFVTPCNVRFSKKIGEELREHRLTDPDNEDQDVLQLSGMCWWLLKRWQTTGLRNMPSVPSSNPYESDYLATPFSFGMRIRNEGPEPSFDDEGMAPHQAAFDALSLSCPPPSTPPSPPAPSPSPNHTVFLPTPDSSSTPVPASSDFAPTSSIPFKRKFDAYGEMTRNARRRDRQRLRRAFETLKSPHRTLSCPVGDAGGQCTRPGELFDREELVTHLEACHGDFLTFKKPGANKVMVRIARKNILNMHPGDDAAFTHHLAKNVLERAAFPLH